MTRHPWRAAVLLAALLSLPSAAAGQVAGGDYVDKTKAGSLELLSLDSRQKPGDAESGAACLTFPVNEPATIDFSGWDGAAISDDGRYVVFTSAASLDPRDNNAVITDVYLRDRKAGRTQILSVNRFGLPVSVSNPAGGCLLGSLAPAISGNGRYVAFVSRMPLTEDAAPLALDDLLRRTFQIYVTDLRTGKTELVSKGTDGGPADAHSGQDGISISDDGRIVTFISQARDLVADRPCSAAPCTWHSYAFDRTTGETSLLSRSPDDVPGNGQTRNVSVSDDGRFAVFQSMAGNLVAGDVNACPNLFDVPSCTDIFLRDLADPDEPLEVVSLNREGLFSTGKSELPWNGGHGQVISSDGRYVLFSGGMDMTPSGGAGTFVRDRLQDRIYRVSVSSTGAAGALTWASLSDNGRYVVGNGGPCTLCIDLDPVQGIFFHDRVTGQTDVTKFPPDEAPANETPQAISSDGRYYLFSSDIAYHDQDTNGALDVFLRDLGRRHLSANLGSKPDPWIDDLGDGTTRRIPSLVRIFDRTADSALPRLLGSEITGGSFVVRPDLRDVFVRIDLERLGHLGGSVSPVVLGGKLQIDDRSFEVRFDENHMDRQVPALYACASRCDRRLARLEGTIGVTSESAVVSIPWELIGLRESPQISRVTLFSSARASDYLFSPQLIDEASWKVDRK